MALPTTRSFFVFHPYLCQDLPHCDCYFDRLHWYPSHDAINNPSPSASYAPMQQVPDDDNPNSEGQHSEHSGDCSANRAFGALPAGET